MKKLFLLLSTSILLFLPSLTQAHQFSREECVVVANVAVISVMMKAQGVPLAEAHRRMDAALDEAAGDPDSVVKDADDRLRLHKIVDYAYAKGNVEDPTAIGEAAFESCVRASKLRGA